jgi:hypothetical protein
MSTPAPPDPPPLIGSWYVKILSGLARANELSLSSPGSSRDASPDHRDTAHGSESDGEQKELAVRKPQEIYTDLDPFLQLPTSVTRYERSRMQICECTQLLEDRKLTCQISLSSATGLDRAIASSLRLH